MNTILLLINNFEFGRRWGHHHRTPKRINQPPFGKAVRLLPVGSAIIWRGHFRVSLFSVTTVSFLHFTFLIVLFAIFIYWAGRHQPECLTGIHNNDEHAYSFFNFMDVRSHASDAYRRPRSIHRYQENSDRSGNPEGLPNYKDQVRSHASDADRCPRAIHRYRENSDRSGNPEGLPDYKDQVRPHPSDADCIDLRPRAIQLRENSDRSGNPEGLPNYKDQVRPHPSDADLRPRTDKLHQTDETQHESDDSSIFNLGNSRLVEADLVDDQDGLNSSPSGVFTALPLEDGVFIQKRCILGIVAVVLIAAATVGGVCGVSDHCRSVVPPSTKETPTECTVFHSDHVTPASSQPTKREKLIVDFLKNISFSPITYPEIVAPEDNATKWLIWNDPLFLKADDPVGRFRLQQRYALLTIWFQSFENQMSLCNWMDNLENECHWDRIRMPCATKDVGGGAGLQDAVTTVNLDTLNLTGTIPPDLALLSSYLTRLTLDNNYELSGTIPASLGHLSHVTKFDLDNNRLTGTIPESFLNLTSLEDFQIHNNMLTGTMPFCGITPLERNLVIQADCGEIDCPCCDPTKCCPGDGSKENDCN